MTAKAEQQDMNAGGNFKLRVVSVGPGSADFLTLAAADALAFSACVVVADRHRSLVESGIEKRLGKDAGKRPRFIRMKRLDETLEYVAENLRRGDVAVAVSGDAGLFSCLGRLRERFPDRAISVIPGVGALQTLCAALGETWEDAEIASVHGREVSPARIAGIAACNAKAFFFCGPERDPAWLCRIFSKRGMDTLDIAVGERLSYPDGRVVRGCPSELGERNFDALSLVRVLNPNPRDFFSRGSRVFRAPEDGEFLRSPFCPEESGAKIPMTRGEVRALVLDRLKAACDSVVWDIGAGTGSVAVTCALASPYGDVHAVERLPEATALLRRNREKFGLHNLWIHEGNAAALLDVLPRPDRVFIGGNGGELRQVLEYIRDLGGGIRVVVSGVTLGTICVAAEILGGPGFDGFDVLQIFTSRGKSVGDSLILTARNPVTLLTADTAAVSGGGKNDS